MTKDLPVSLLLLRVLIVHFLENPQLFGTMQTVHCHHLKSMKEVGFDFCSVGAQNP